MAGAVLLFLDSRIDLTPQLLGYLGYSRADLVAPMADNSNDAGRVDAGGGVQAVGKEGATADGVQGLLGCGLHPRTRPSGQHDHCHRLVLGLRVSFGVLCSISHVVGIPYFRLKRIPA